MSLLRKTDVPRHPDPPPLETDDVLIVAVCAGLWAVALLTLAVARLSGAPVHRWWLTMCGCGLALGLAGVSFCRRRRRAMAGPDAPG